MARYRKKLRRYNYADPPQYIGGGELGQLIGTGVGAGAGAFLGNPALGAKLGGMAGGFIGNEFEGEPAERERPIRYASSSYGYRYGGKTGGDKKKKKHGGKYKNGGNSPGIKLRQEFRKLVRDYDFLDDQELEIAKSAIKEGRTAKQAVRYIQNRRSEGATRGEALTSKRSGGKINEKSFKKAYENYRDPAGYKHGGVTPMGQDAVKYNGPKHEQGGIPIDGAGNPTNKNNAEAEVEGGETRDGDYIFSDTLTVPGTQMTFADAHERLIQEGATEPEIAELKAMQEQAQETEGVQGGDDVGSQTAVAQRVTNKGATGKGAGEPVGYKRMMGGGKMKRYQFGGDIYERRGQKRLGNKGVGNVSLSSQAQPELSSAPITGYSTGTQASGALDKGFDWDKVSEIAGYAVPSALRAGLALTDKGVQDTPRMRANKVPVQSRAFRGAERDIESGYRAILADPNASTTEKLAAQSQLIGARSDLAGKEADYRSRQQRFNVGQEQQAQAQNIRSFQQDREIKAREDAAKKKLVTEAVEMPLTQYRADEAGKRQQIANVLISANQIQDPTDRRNTIMRNLKALGLSRAEIQEIIAQQ